ncbi:hypothetical protein [Ilumatobacter sp.]|uniref:hypothetical protein n=1 Tax=Ilumatobacter sp. TaxID=1967498 RepID=UPI003AF6782B
MNRGGGRRGGGARRHRTVTELAGGPERDECRDLPVAAYPDVAGCRELTERRLPVGLLSPE